MENYTICNCKNVTYFDVAEALHNSPTFSDVEKTFEEVQKITHCSTGCGGCHGKILDAISEIMDKKEDHPKTGDLLFSCHLPVVFL